MRVPEGPRWGSRAMERWVTETIRQLRTGEVARVTFEAVWRGGVKRRLLTSTSVRRHRQACERAMALAGTWTPPADRIQARLWDGKKQYVSSLTWQIGRRPKPRALNRGELPQRPLPEGEEPPQPAPEDLIAACSALEQRLSELESTPTPPTDERVEALEQRLRSMEERLVEAEARLSAAEEENQFLRESLDFVWNGLSVPVFTDLYKRLQIAYEDLGIEWSASDGQELPTRWPNLE